MARLKNIIKSSHINEHGDAVAYLGENYKIIVWKGEWHETADGLKYHLFLDGFKYKVIDLRTNRVIAGIMCSFISRDALLSLIKRMGNEWSKGFRKECIRYTSRKSR